MPTVQLPHNPLLRNSLRLLLMFPAAMVLVAFGGIFGAILGMLVGLVAGWDVFLWAGIGSIIIGVGLIVDFIGRMDLHFVYGVIYGVVGGIILGGVVALSYGGMWIIIGLIIGVLESSIGVVLHQQKSINSY